MTDTPPVERQHDVVRRLERAAAATAATMREHRDVGADHVTVGLPIGTGFTPGVDHLEGLAPTLHRAG